MAQNIEHTGVITGINVNVVQVTITQHEACEECHAKSACVVAGKNEKLIDIECNANDFKPGDEVIVYGNQSVGFLAVLYAFIIPFMLILIVLIASGWFTSNELVSGGIAVLALVLYYIVLSFFEKKLKNKLKFNIRMS
ncbi:MAG: SoxR reducing system RseC family protein [Paludibacter sp.]